MWPPDSSAPRDHKHTYISLFLGARTGHGVNTFTVHESESCSPDAARDMSGDGVATA